MKQKLNILLFIMVIALFVLGILMSKPNYTSAAIIFGVIGIIGNINT